MTYLGIECEGDGNDDDGGVGDDEGSGGDNNDNLPPDAVIDKKDPCIEKGIINRNNANTTIAAQNAEILSKSTTNEYGTNQKLTSLLGNTYVNTPVTTDGSTGAFTPGFTWNSTDGYTVGWSHGHPGGNSASPDDIFVMIDNLTNPDLIAAGSQSIKFYRDNVSMTIVTKTGNYVVTVKDWGKLQTLFDRFKDDSGGFDDNYVNNRDAYLADHTYLGLGLAGVYSLMSIFGDAINIYQSPYPSTPYSPLTVDPTDANHTVIPKPCPQ
ncbi:hypothetical protein SAMN05428975_5403 [Mucilaginibacter sp. OK268]|uniref:hypothetical protein n=1 Tax=Mucilaginibacter sp. OK268 TaxID=1881048 RepID=UPI00088724F8|nr:hypothetical protein [Mucilaginibacter sp. OK268]SDQ00459.1 hypothetical protein SAMN05428975_5403 [Mucilaginibacter sp. OK268]